VWGELIVKDPQTGLQVKIMVRQIIVAVLWFFSRQARRHREAEACPQVPMLPVVRRERRCRLRARALRGRCRDATG